MMKQNYKRAVDPEKARQLVVDTSARLCDRCSKVYRVDEEGMQVEREDCIYHFGRLFRKKGNRGRCSF